MESQVSHKLNKNLDSAIKKTQDYLFREQYDEGFWWGELESNPTMEAEFILLHYFLGIRDEKKFIKLSNHIKNQQREDGTWGQYYGAPGDLSTSVECYLALKIAGYSENDQSMLKAKDFIVSKGGIEETKDIVLMRPQAEIESDVKKMLTEIPEIQGCKAKLEILMPLMMFICRLKF